MYCTIASTPPETAIRFLNRCAYWKSPWKSDEFLAEILATIPAPERQWYSDRRTWGVHEQHTETLADLVEKHYRRRPAIEEANNDLHAPENS